MTYGQLNPDPHMWWVYLSWLRPLTDYPEGQKPTRLDHAVAAWSAALKATPWAIQLLETARRQRNYTEVREESNHLSIQLEGMFVSENIEGMDWTRIDANAFDFRRPGWKRLRSDNMVSAQCLVHLAQVASRADHTVTLIMDEDGFGIVFVAGKPYEVREPPYPKQPVLLWFDPLHVVAGLGVGRLPVLPESRPPAWITEPPEIDDPSVPMRRPWPYFVYGESPHDADKAQAAKDELHRWAKRFAPQSLFALMDEEYVDTPPDPDDGSVPSDVRDAFDQAVAVIIDGDSGPFEAAAEAVFTSIYSAGCDKDVERRAKFMMEMLDSVAPDEKKSPDMFGRSRWSRHEMFVAVARWGRAVGLRRPVRVVPDRR